MSPSDAKCMRWWSSHLEALTHGDLCCHSSQGFDPITPIACSFNWHDATLEEENSLWLPSKALRSQHTFAEQHCQRCERGLHTEFCADVSSFFWLSRYCIFFLLTWLLYSAFQLSILSEVCYLNFLRWLVGFLDHFPTPHEQKLQAHSVAYNHLALAKVRSSKFGRYFEFVGLYMAVPFLNLLNTLGFQ